MTPFLPPALTLSARIMAFPDQDLLSTINVFFSGTTLAYSSSILGDPQISIQDVPGTSSLDFLIKKVARRIQAYAQTTPRDFPETERQDGAALVDKMEHYLNRITVEVIPTRNVITQFLFSLWARHLRTLLAQAKQNVISTTHIGSLRRTNGIATSQSGSTLV